MLGGGTENDGGGKLNGPSTPTWPLELKYGSSVSRLLLLLFSLGTAGGGIGGGGAGATVSFGSSTFGSTFLTSGLTSGFFSAVSKSNCFLHSDPKISTIKKRN